MIDRLIKQKGPGLAPLYVAWLGTAKIDRNFHNVTLPILSILSIPSITSYPPAHKLVAGQPAPNMTGQPTLRWPRNLRRDVAVIWKANERRRELPTAHKRVNQWHAMTKNL